ncbi:MULTISPECIES: aromatic amino acid transporter [Glaesserella]|uniref:Aromatic amino acid permease n=1 Tax=Glaesserella australis TaxID=2094024 RepID=A0A328C0J1_9PAST|nr:MULTISPECIES: aromatic amino acid transporter [Glaesserella]AUI66757.1 transposase [Glaesserella sp. 15-184]RAL19809.1 transposase [Glaesserella australis]
MSKQPSVFGGACIIASVCVGAGMLGLPSAGAGAWTIWTILVMLLTMIMMTLSGWMLLESYKQYDLRASFNTVTKAVLGNQVNLINNLAVYFVGGILLYAYITSSGLILQDLLGLDSKIASILFVLVFGAFVWHSTRAVDRISVILIVFMVLSFTFSIFGLTSNISLDTLFDTAKSETSEYTKYAMMMLPVALTSFGYHHSVSSMRAYYGEEKKASRAILYGTLISLFLYLVWILSIFGNLPRDQFAPIIASDGNIDVLLKTLGGVIDSPHIKQALNAFSMAAILSSFIGVGLGVFDFLADFFKFENSKAGRTKSWLVTFLPPLVLSVLFPFGFLKAIGYAGAVATIWTCIIPAILVYKVRQQNPNQQGFIACGGSFMVVALILFGILVATFHFLTMFNMLPIFKG